MKLVCVYCNRQGKNPGGNAAHEQRCTLNPNKTARYHSPLAGAKKGSVPWNAGLTAKDDIRIANASPKITAALIGKGRPQTAENKKRISETSKRNGLSGGYRKGSGIGKSGWYQGIWCDSSWELAYVIWCKANGKCIVKNTETFKYEFKGKVRKYLPDFIVDGQLVEIKGRHLIDELTAAKLAVMNGRVKLLLACDMKPILDSVAHLQPIENLYGR